MEDIPQPATEPYESGQEVRVYLGTDDADASYHGTQCIVVDRHEDDLDEETGRPLDRFSYDVRCVKPEKVPPVTFRHSDLVPLTESN